MSELTQLRYDIEEIKQRNRRVENDKAWETSWTRRFGVAIITYVFVVIVFVILELGNPWKSAVIPTLGFLLSTLSLGLLKKLWMKNRS